jgi:hypothetical protein
VLLEQPVDDGALGVAGSVDTRGLGEGHMPPQPEEASWDARGWS